jgi:hypothetical protein
MTEVIIPKLDTLVEGEQAACINEANFMEKDGKVFYGSNYGRLEEIKKKYDPKDMFHVLGAVGNDTWVQTDEGRSCQA